VWGGGDRFEGEVSNGVFGHDKGGGPSQVRRSDASTERDCQGGIDSLKNYSYQMKGGRNIEETAAWQPVKEGQHSTGDGMWNLINGEKGCQTLPP